MEVKFCSNHQISIKISALNLFEHTEKNSATRRFQLLALNYEFQWLGRTDVSHHCRTLALGFHPVLVQAQPGTSGQSDIKSRGTTRVEIGKGDHTSEWYFEPRRTKLSIGDDSENFLVYRFFCACGINCVNFLSCVANFLLDCYLGFFGHFCLFFGGCEISKTKVA